MSTPDGNTIHEPFLHGHRMQEQSIRTHWPRQLEPTHSQRRLWRKYIESNYIRYGLKWRQPLGPTPMQHRPQFEGLPKIDEPEIKTPAHDSNSLREYIYRLPRWHMRLLFQWTQEATDVQIWRAFRSRQRITIASDGGLKRRLGTHGWKIVTRSGCTLFSGSGPVDGPHNISHSTRSELGGLTAPLLLVLSLAKFWGLNHRCRYKWLTDSKAAISKVTYITTTGYSPRRYPDDIDYVTAIQELHRSLGGRKLKSSWIKGHQDEDKDYDDLSAAAKLNVDQRTGIDLWQKAIEKEIRNVFPAFDFLDDDASIPPGYSFVDTYFIFDIKMDLTCKALLVARGSMTEPTKDETFASVVN